LALIFGKLFEKQTMDNINKQQPEDNFKNLSHAEAQEKIKALIKMARNTCFFCTNIKTGEAFSTRPMSVQKIDDDGTLWFLSPIDSDKNEHLLHDPAVQLLFKGSDHSDFLSLYGNAVVGRDEQKIEELWEPALKTWFTEGKDDPRITVVQFTPEHGYYWDTKHAQIVSFAMQMIGAAIGKTLDDSVEGNLRP
jgi:general stress protein 26